MPTSIEPRRSSRLRVHDSNGRDYLASLMPGWTRDKLETWLMSVTVRPHLQLWYQLCVKGPSRFNDAIEWINTGEKGYYYCEYDLEEDLLLMCLCEGSPSSEAGNSADPATEECFYADVTVKTGGWLTQELWARAAWRIVHANAGPGQAFNKTVTEHPAACYGFVIDLLTTAFHSLTYRGKGSCYEWLINGAYGVNKQRLAELTESAKYDDEDDEDISSRADSGSSTETSGHSSDLDWSSIRAVSLHEPKQEVRLRRRLTRMALGPSWSENGLRRCR